MNNSLPKKKFFIQDNLYNFPYHYLPEKKADYIIKPFRIYFWLFDYILLHEYLIQKIKNYENFEILDFGCGDGKLINELKKYNKNNYYGYEISKKAISFFKAFNSDIPVIENLDELQLKKNFFDIIIFSEVIEHIHDDDVKNVIDTLTFCLKKNGLIIVTAPHENLPVTKKHFRHYNYTRLEKNFSNINFEVIEKKFLFKIDIFKNIIRKIFFNRYFLINSNFLNKLFYKLNKFYFFTNEDKCETIFLILKKK